MLAQADGGSISDLVAPPASADERSLDVIGIADDYRSLIAGLVARRRELGLPQHAVDEIAGLTTAYTSKIEAHMRGLGRMSLDSLLGALGIRLVLVRTTPHHLRQRRLMGASCGVVRHGLTQADSHAA